MDDGYRWSECRWSDTRDTIGIERDYIRQINQATWKLAREVYRKNQDYSWREDGFASFNKYSKAVLPYGPKRLFYWCMVVEKVDEYGIDITQYFDLPMEAIVEAFKLDSLGQILFTLEEARNNDFTWLRRQVMESTGKLKPEDKLHSKVFRLSPVQYSALNDALEVAEKVTGSRNIGDGVEAISQEFVGTYVGVATDIEDQFKLKILERDDYTCQQCGKRKDFDHHHIIRRSQRPDLIKDEANCVTLCRDCHNKQENNPEEHGQHMPELT